jgi:hypothetical protein
VLRRSTVGGNIVLSAANIQAMVRLRKFIVWEQARMALRDMEHNRYRLEQGKFA